MKGEKVEIFRRAGRYLLGAVLVLSAAAKAADFSGFSRSVMVLGSLPGTLAGPIVALVLLVEIGLGVLLFTGYRPRGALLSAAGLFLGFSVVLSAALLREIGGTCGCFGSLGPRLPYRYQALADIALAAGAIAAAGEFSLRRRRWLLHTLLALWAGMLIISPETARDQEASESFEAAKGGEGSRVMLFADFSDFGCQLCLDDFLALCDSLNDRFAAGEVRVRLIARRDSARGVEVQERFLEGWARGNGYRFPVSLDSGEVFGSGSVTKTTVLVERTDGGILAREPVPLGQERRSRILSLIGRAGGGVL